MTRSGAEVRRKVEDQFGRSAEAYVDSLVHAKGASLTRLVELLEPKANWRVLDVATGAGHTALAIKPFVSSIIAADATFRMLVVAKQLAAEKGQSPLQLTAAKAANLPFREDSFDLVTCRIAAHHFEDIRTFITDAVRVLRTGGKLAVVDNIVPGSRQTARKSKDLNRAGRYVNSFDKLRDPSHCRALNRDEWLELFYQSNLVITHQETIKKQLDLDEWANRMCVAEDDRVRLRAMLLRAPAAVKEYLLPQVKGDHILFTLTELLLVGLKER